jgi:hypothetical protein
MFKLITNVADPLTVIALAGLKDYLTLDGTAHDQTVTDLLGFVLQWWKKEGGNIPVTYELQLPCFASLLELKKNVGVISSVKYYGTDDTLQTADVNTYRLYQPDDLPAYLEPVDAWPAVSILSRSDNVQVRFTTTIGEFDKGAIRCLVGLVNQNREGFELRSGLERLFSIARGYTYG